MVGPSSTKVLSRRKPSPAVARGLATVVAMAAVACGAPPPRFPLREPLTVDADRAPFAPKPPEYESQTVWDAVDKSVFHPLSEALSVTTSGEAVNVSSIDEVPASSWFTPRIGLSPMSPAEVAVGPCAGRPPIPTDVRWTISNAKPNGANPGFLAKSADGQRFLVKLESREQPERATSADVIGSKLWHAAGYTAPCNRVVRFDPSILVIDPEATARNRYNDEVPFTRAMLDEVLERAPRMEDGRYRAATSVLLEGEPLGPWAFTGTHEGDRNDVVPHEDRRDVRAMAVLSAWVNHQDAREQNTLSLWRTVDGERGYVQHAVIDWGDSLGQSWPDDSMWRRNGHAYFLDWSQMAVDFVSFGVVERPWDHVEKTPAGDVWGYTDVEHFEPDEWRAGYQAPPFSRMTERDAAWMARIVARFRDEHVDALVDRVELTSPMADRWLRHLLKGRRDRIVRRYLTRLSPLAWPRVEAGRSLCLEDFAVVGGLTPSGARRYSARAWVGDLGTRRALGRSLPAQAIGDRFVCVSLPRQAGARPGRPRYVVVDVFNPSATEPLPKPARVHLYAVSPERYRVVGLERPLSRRAPSLRR